MLSHARVRTFRLENLWLDGFHLEGRPLISQHLMRLDLIGVNLRNKLCYFLSWSLEHLEMHT
jgi:hypothetical protein